MSTESPDGKIRLRLVSYGDRVVEVDEADYVAAERDATLSLFLAEEVRKIPTDWCVIRPDHVVIHPDALDDRPRPALSGPDPTAAMEAIVAAVRPAPGCGNCGGRACPAEVAAAIVEQVRAEGLVLLSIEDADQVIVDAVLAAGVFGVDPPE